MKYRMAQLKLFSLLFSLSFRFIAVEYYFPCLPNLIKTCEGLGEFQIVIQKKTQVDGLQNFLEFSQLPKCSDEATQTWKKVLYCIYKILLKKMCESNTSKLCLLISSSKDSYRPINGSVCTISFILLNHFAVSNWPFL